jgi:hypothetical protein
MAVEAAEGKGNQVRILRPLDKKYLRFHLDLEKSEKINEPSEAFKQAYLERA